MTGVRARLVLIFLLGSLLPLGATVWLSSLLLEHSLRLQTTDELHSLSGSLEQTARQLYQRTRADLRRQARAGSLPPVAVPPVIRQEFLSSGQAETFRLDTAEGAWLYYLVRQGASVQGYRAQVGVPMHTVRGQLQRAHRIVERLHERDYRQGFWRTLVSLAVVSWLAAFLLLLFALRQTTQPIQRLTAGLAVVAGGRLDARVPESGPGEVRAATRAFNTMATQLQQSQERLLYLTRLSGWQALGRKMAHELKNSLTPIRLTMEEVVARRGHVDAAFLQQAAEIVVDEVASLERRVRAFTDFAAEPPLRMTELSLDQIVKERIALLRVAHPGVRYDVLPAEHGTLVCGDEDLVRIILNNLLENAAQAVGEGGAVRVRVQEDTVEVHDSGPGLSTQARATLFEPTISFKKAGMGLGLSIARKSALLCHGELELIDSELGGAAFRLTLPASSVPVPAVEWEAVS